MNNILKVLIIILILISNCFALAPTSKVRSGGPNIFWEYLKYKESKKEDGFDRYRKARGRQHDYFEHLRKQNKASKHFIYFTKRQRDNEAYTYLKKRNRLFGKETFLTKFLMSSDVVFPYFIAPLNGIFYGINADPISNFYDLFIINELYDLYVYNNYTSRQVRRMTHEFLSNERPIKLKGKLTALDGKITALFIDNNDPKKTNKILFDLFEFLDKSKVDNDIQINYLVQKAGVIKRKLFNYSQFCMKPYRKAQQFIASLNRKQNNFDPTIVLNFDLTKINKTIASALSPTSNFTVGKLPFPWLVDYDKEHGIYYFDYLDDIDRIKYKAYPYQGYLYNFDGQLINTWNQKFVLSDTWELFFDNYHYLKENFYLGYHRMTTHSMLIEARPTLFAGSITIVDGVVKEIDNLSLGYESSPYYFLNLFKYIQKNNLLDMKLAVNYVFYHYFAGQDKHVAIKGFNLSANKGMLIAI